MSVTPPVTYPGVYIQEIPSAVHTITGVATSITAFVGYTVRGPENRAIEILSWSDFERVFGGLAADSELSYAVKQFFDNGGTDALVVRVGKDDGAVGEIEIGDNSSPTPARALTIDPISKGAWANQVIVDVDYDGVTDPNSFNLTVTDLGTGTVETFNNVTTDPSSNRFVFAVVNDEDNGSKLVIVKWPTPAATSTGPRPAQTGTTGGDLNLSSILNSSPPGGIAYSKVRISGGPLSYGTLSQVWGPPGFTDRTVAARTIGGPPFTLLSAANDAMYFGFTTAFSSLVFTLSTLGNGLKTSWQYSQGNGHWNPLTVKDGTSNFKNNGSVTWTQPTDWATDTVNGPGPLYWVQVSTSKNATTQPTSIQIFNVLPPTPYFETGLVTVVANGQKAPGSLLGLCNLLQSQTNRALQVALQSLPANPLPGAEINCVPSDTALGIRVTAVGDNHQDLIITFLDSTNDVLKLTNTPTNNLSANAPNPNVAHYWFGRNLSTSQAQEMFVAAGIDGAVLPTATGASGNAGLIGDIGPPATGIYALEKVDLFNILCIPDLTRAMPGNPYQSYLDASGFTKENSILNEAMTYCQKRRAFLLVDTPPQVHDVQSAIDWFSNGLNVHAENGAAYFPRIKLPDHLNKNQLRTFAPCGVMAGLYARTDANRGVWKAPAGTEASLNGVQGLVYDLTDPENGKLNPLGLNCLRIFPVYGSICWGARTLAGSDQEASQWKYVPVRRFALFLEESLYRGTKWVVFEPNDEPLWAQIRLNVGAFMHSLFRQGAFQGMTPKDAYFVKCDNETTTQDDINRGIVNILVGFAPLKPAEFVVIKISQIAGQIQT